MESSVYRLGTGDWGLKTTEGWPRAATRRSAARGMWKAIRPAGDWLNGKNCCPAGRGELRSLKTSGGSSEMRAERGLDRRSVVDFHERSIARLEEKLGIDERAKERIAHGGVEPPKPARLRLGEAQPRHLEKLALDSPEHFFYWTILLGRHRLFTSVG